MSKNTENQSPIIVKKLVQTCMLCPEQWEGELIDGRFIYIRYRHGNLRVGIGATLNDAVSSGYQGKGEQVFFKQFPKDPFLGYENLKKEMPDNIILPKHSNDSTIE